MTRWACGPVGALLCAVLAGCAAASGPVSPSGAPLAASAADQRLAGVCPPTVVVQTQWEPQAEHGAVYQLLGPGYTVDTDHKRVSGPLVASGRDTGVRVEVRAGGPAIGFVTVPAQMYLDTSITLGMVETDLAVATSARQPVTHVLAPLAKSPQILMWDPASHPGWRGLGDIAASGAKVVVSKDREYPAWLVATGLIKQAQLDFGYTGNPTRFVTDPTIVQQGYATGEPYVYEHEVPAWDRPVRYQLLADLGYPIYPQALSVRTAQLPALSACLAKLVPVIQQAQLDYLTNPRPTDDLIVRLVDDYHDGWEYTPGDAAYAVSTMTQLHIVANDASGALGGLDPTRIQATIDTFAPLITASGGQTRPGLTAADLATNRFINPTIRLH